MLLFNFQGHAWLYFLLYFMLSQSFLFSMLLAYFKFLFNCGTSLGISESMTRSSKFLTQGQSLVLVLDYDMRLLLAAYKVLRQLRWVSFSWNRWILPCLVMEARRSSSSMLCVKGFGIYFFDLSDFLDLSDLSMLQLCLSTETSCSDLLVRLFSILFD